MDILRESRQVVDDARKAMVTTERQLDLLEKNSVSMQARMGKLTSRLKEEEHDTGTGT